MTTGVRSNQLTDVLARLGQVKTNGTGYMTRCPAHNDNKFSLSVKDGERGVVLNCFGGCSTESIMEAIGLPMSALFYDERTLSHGKTEKPPKAKSGGRETRYQIKDRAGVLVAEHVRYDYPDGTKSFAWYRNGEKGLNGLSVRDLPLYKVELLPDDWEGVEVYLVEGEKACDALIEQGYHAVGTVCGASVIPNDEVLYQLLGWETVYLWPDNDPQGHKHMDAIAERLKVMGVEPKIINIPDAPKGGDALDYFQGVNRG